MILDTAGRLHIDDELMQQLERIDRRVEPDQVYLVVDGMTGQDAVNSAKAFNEALELDGVIMTKLDGDARGGAALSVKAVTGVPIKFIGTGEHLDALEEFHPERHGRAASWAWATSCTLVEQAQEKFDQDEMAPAGGAARARASSRSTTSAACCARSRSWARCNKLMGMIPGMGSMNEMMDDVDAESDMRRLLGIIDSMTPDERRNPSKIDRSEPPPPHRRRRRRRAARGQRAGQAVRRHGRHDEEDGRHGHARADEACSSSLPASGLFNPGAKLAKAKQRHRQAAHQPGESGAAEAAREGSAEKKREQRGTMTTNDERMRSQHDELKMTTFAWTFDRHSDSTSDSLNPISATEEHSVAVKIRMKKMGRKHRPFFRICAVDGRNPRDGRVIEELGTYDPMVRDTDARAVLNGERIELLAGRRRAALGEGAPC